MHNPSAVVSRELLRPATRPAPNPGGWDLAIQPATPVAAPNPQPRPASNSRLHTAPATAAPPPPWPIRGERCAEKGCIFPAIAGARGICHYHTCLRREPAPFESHQPSRLVLEYAKFGITDTKFDPSRAREVRLRVRQREKFLETA